jgi:hypothetical protein
MSSHSIAYHWNPIGGVAKTDTVIQISKTLLPA